MSMRPGRHGGMPSSTLEEIILRNANFLSVRRNGSGDGQAGLYNAVSGAYISGIGGGWIPEYSKMQNQKYGCACNPSGLCRTGMHGTGLIRGWRNILFELLTAGRLRPTKEVKKMLGEAETYRALDYGLSATPNFDPGQVDSYESL